MAELRNSFERSDILSVKLVPKRKNTRDGIADVVTRDSQTFGVFAKALSRNTKYVIFELI